ncbi:hypothetical protein H6F43_04235 [Leptolyngbya sp. FACHB-36]|uniref:hypothetical protein n=1 Tax=Leptolyngbya sp. FACHB-36 TaxID=2692808 RepID=UPI0016808970|nr:hypothetical protein [Leptolyngbya sp. FACHB-36]MBD2019392.1 hypothetical protein [Leptolyngbya sp. FACHB-36]
MTQLAALETTQTIDSQQRLREIAIDTGRRVRRSVWDNYQSGLNLIEAQTLLKGEDRFVQWLETEALPEIEISKSQAYNLINNAKRFESYFREFTEAEFVEFGKLSQTAMNLLGSPSTPEPAIAEIVSQIRSGQSINAAAARRAIEKHVSQHTAEEVQTLYAEVGVFRATAHPKMPWIFETEGYSRAFRSLDEAAEAAEGIRQTITARRQQREVATCSRCRHQSIDSDSFRCEATTTTHPINSDPGAAGCRLYKPQLPVAPFTPAPVSVLESAEELPTAPFISAPAFPPTDEFPIIGKTERVPYDFYSTPNGVVQSLLERVSIAGRVMEPCAGDGAIAKHFIDKNFADCFTNDVHVYEGFDCDCHLDAANGDSWEIFSSQGEIDWVITNPPYGNDLPIQILSHAWNHAQVGVAFLVRLSFCEPCDSRREWLQSHSDQLTHLITLNPRPKFRKDVAGGDQVTVAWMVWQKNFSWEALGVHCPFSFVNWTN